MGAAYPGFSLLKVGNYKIGDASNPFFLDSLLDADVV